MGFNCHRPQVEEFPSLPNPPQLPSTAMIVLNRPLLDPPPSSPSTHPKINHEFAVTASLLHVKVP
jgi:hypothetical protein